MFGHTLIWHSSTPDWVIARAKGDSVWLDNFMREAQSEKYRQLVRMYRRLVPPEQQYGITFWGFNDRDTWIRGFFSLKDWPCLFDEELEPKPTFFGFLEGLQEEM